MSNFKFKSNPRAARELAKEIERNTARKGQRVKLTDKQVRELQQQINKLGK